jgi:predicted dienelactone hydrolase
MSRTGWFALALCLLLFAAPCSFAQDKATPPPQTVTPGETSTDHYKSPRGPFAVRIIDETWHDTGRIPPRDIPVRIYLPTLPDPASHDVAKPGTQSPTKLPVIIFSHGLGASSEMYGYFGRHMASCGYIVIHPSHHGSDTEQLRAWFKEHGGIGGGEAGKTARDGWLMHSINDPDNLRNRPLDITFIIDQLSKADSLKDKADVARIGVAGHSFGAYTAMAIGGMTIDLPAPSGSTNKSFRDPRVKAVLPMSPEGPGVMGITESSWDHFGAPVLFLTGTRDYGVANRSVEWREAGFDHVRGVDHYLITLNGAGHMTFGTPGQEDTSKLAEGNADNPAPNDNGMRSRIRERVRQRIREQMNTGGLDPDQAHHTKMIESFSAAFFDAYVLEDPKAREWLQRAVSAKSDEYTSQYKAGQSDSEKPAPSK